MTAAGNASVRSTTRHSSRRRSRLRVVDTERRMGRHHAQLHLGHTPAIPRASSITTAAPTCGVGQCRHLRHGRSTRSICGRCRCSTATAGASRGRSRCVPGRMCACAGCAPRRCTSAIADHEVTHLCGAPIVMATLLNAPARDEAARARGAVLHGRGAAARGRAGGDEGAAGFDVTHLYGLTEMLRPGVVNDWHGNGTRCRSPSRREEGAPGRALRRTGGARRDATPTRMTPVPPTARPSAR